MTTSLLNTEDEWKNVALSEIAERVTRKNKINTTKRNLTISANLGLIDQEEYFTKTIASKDNSHYIKLLKGEYAYNKSYSSSAPMGATKRLDKYNEGAVSTLYLCFKLKNSDIIISDFFKHLVDSSHWEKELSQIAVEGARNHGLLNVSPQDFFEIQIKLPSLNTQKKIAEFLSALDDMITLQESKIELSDKQKKGYVQRIFSRELRFRDDNGNEYPEWEEKRLGELGEVVTGNTPSKNNPLFWEKGNHLWVTTPDLHTSKNVYTSKLKLTDAGFDKTRKLPAGSLLITSIASIGINGILRVAGSTNQQINALIPKENFNVDFLYYVMEYEKEKFARLAGKTAVSIINKAIFSNFIVTVPSLPEQEKIASFLSTLDDQITLEKEKLTQLKLQKQGYMQRIFT